MPIVFYLADAFRFRQLLAAAALLGAMLFAISAQAAAGSVLNLSGPLFAQKSDGTRLVLGVGSSIEAGDMLVTEDKTFARLRFADGGELTMRPGTQFKVESFSFNQAEPARDNVVFSLFKGALRTITGLIGKRGDRNAYRMTTPTATIGIRGTQFTAEFITDGMGDGRPPGLYLDVAEGRVQLSNAAGQQELGAGQYGFAGSADQAPRLLPENPAIPFDAPAFIDRPGLSSGGGNLSAAACEVR